ncbi:MAG: hypothetical protein ASARMPREDX12_007008 [Alectoria sarmentosa]|nr:MAG: hypothetical protein ASARMPREDX12_007008 [Alectoria sarmentosa]
MIICRTHMVHMGPPYKDIQDALSMLERCKSTFLVSLNFDQTQMLVDFQTKLDLIASRPVAQAYHQLRPMVPFPLDARSFVGREELITALTQGFIQHSRMALHGLGGVGKSQIATEYLCRLHQTEPDVAIFWVSMADRSRFLRSYEDIALEIPESFRKDHGLLVMEPVHGEDPLMSSKTPVLVKDWLNSKNSGKWLLILDNADDPEAFSDINDHGKSLTPYLPPSGNGHILITSRFRGVALTLASSEDSLIHVTPMTPQEAISLLRTRVPKDTSTESDTAELAKALDYLPLAIKQATGYITATSTSIKDYLRLFSKDDNYQRRLLEKTYRDIGRDTHDDLQDSVILTLQISFDQIRLQRPAAANVLSLMGTLNREGIPIDLLTGLSVDELESKDDIGMLIQYSLISRNDNLVTFSMHRLVQLTIRTWLSRQGSLGKWQAEALRLLSDALPVAVVTVTTQYLATAGLYSPHASVVVDYMFETKVDRERQMNLKSGLHLYEYRFHVAALSAAISYVTQSK